MQWLSNNKSFKIGVVFDALNLHPWRAEGMFDRRRGWWEKFIGFISPTISPNFCIPPLLQCART